MDLKSKLQKVSTKVVGLTTLATVTLCSNAFAEGPVSVTSDLEKIGSSMTGVFSSVKTVGMTIVTSAIGLGLIFVGAKWLWGKVRIWLSNV